MFDTKTAFRHFKCHGRIIHRERLGQPIFQCETCWTWSPDILDLILDPRLNTVMSDGDNPPDFADINYDPASAYHPDAAQPGNND